MKIIEVDTTAFENALAKLEPLLQKQIEAMRQEALDKYNSGEWPIECYLALFGSANDE